MSDRERFEELVRSVAEPLRRYALRRIDRDLAEDVVADALLVMWRRLDDVPEHNPLPWCYGVTRHCLDNALRAQRRQRGLIARITALTPPSVLPTTDASGAATQLHTALDRLSEDDRELLRLWAWESLTPSEIATVVGATANVVNIRLHRARKRLREHLGLPEGKSRSGSGHEQVSERRAP